MPDDDVAGLAHGFNVDGKQLFDFAVAVAGDQGDFADLLAGVDNVEKLCEVGGRGGRADFDADRVLDAAEVFDVGVVGLASAVADPDEVGGCCVVAAVAGG